MKRRSKRARGWNYRVTGGITAIFLLLFVLGFYMTQRVLLDNAQELGNELASRYAEEELQNLRAEELLLTLGTETLAEQAEAGAGQQELEQWAHGFFQKVLEAEGSGRLALRAVVGGVTVSAGDTSGSGYDGSQTEWYRQAMASGGEIVFTASRGGAEVGDTVLTMAQRCGATEYVMAFELYLEELPGEGGGSLPAGSSYYLCDVDGELLYAKTQTQAPPEETARYIRTVFEQIQAGELDGAQTYIYDMDAEKRAVYFHTAPNGWVSIITIPYSALLGDLRQVFDGAMLVCGGFLLFLILMSVREYRLQKRMVRVNETVAALGNLYYSIYRVNWAQGTYESVKSAEDLAHRIPARGRYDQLLEVVGQVIDQETFDQFKTSFSLENIRQLVERNVSDFGGDFRRLFDGEYRWVSVRLLFDSALRQEEAVLCFRQVEEEKERQLRQLHVLENALDQARESEAAREQFFSQMSHDMRTPLNVIIGTVELAQQSTAEKIGDCLKKIQVSASHLLELINDILEMSRMERTDLSLKNDPCDLRETVSQCLSGFQTQAELQHKSLEASFSLTHPQVYADAFRLQQVLNNLISNAMKFTNEGDKIQVEVSQPSRQEQGICCIVVRDTGVGMSEDFLPKLFTPYARESRFGVQTVLGTGLGMTIVHTIVTHMGGQIQVESAPGQGSAFTLTIPMEPVAEKAETAPAEAAAPAPPAEDPTRVLRGKRVLLAEDYEMNLEIATELLKLAGARVTQARNGQEAVERFAQSQPGEFDVILMDMNMPVLDGCGAAAAIRAMDRPDAASVPILAVTANDFAEDVAATAQAGMNAHIAKPIDMRQLAGVLQGLEGWS